MHTVLVTPELAHASAPSDLGAFAWNWSRLLRQAGDDVRIILTRPPLHPSPTWRQAYDDLDIALDVLEEPARFVALPHGYRWSRRMSEVVYEHLPPETEIVYYAERDANAMHHLRRRRFAGAGLPVVATVLHGGSAWQMEQARRWPHQLEDLEQDFFERYVAAHSDWVIAPSQALLDWVERAGWTLPPSERTRVAGYPCPPDTMGADGRAANARWLALHHEIAAQSQSQARAARPNTPAPLPRPPATPPPALPASAALSPPPGVASGPSPTRAVDVCIPYYNLGAYLPALLAALDQQTSQEFNVFVVNDGSPDPQAVAVFEQMARTYADHPHWRFITTENQGVCAARNLAASLGTAKYLCFVDADNLPLPTMIERFLTGIRQSGDDVLTCYLYTVEREGEFKPGLDLRQPPLAHYLPVGNCLALGVFTNPFGDINCIMRRAVFAAVGGFTTDIPNAINHEDRELLTRLAFAGHRLDVIPEFLCYYRHRAASRLRTTDQYLNDARVMRVYLERLRQAGQPELAALAPFALGLLHRDDQYGAPPVAANLLHFLTFEVSAVTLARALARRLRHHLRARLNRSHQPR